MDKFEPGKGIPSFQLKIMVSDSITRRKLLFHQLILQGAKDPNYFNIVISAEGMLARRSAPKPHT